MVDLRVIVADDEPIAREGVVRMLSGVDGVELIASCRTGAEALRAIKQHRPDAALLDVAMPGMSGMQVARALSPADRPHIVFVTAFNAFAVQAFELFAIDYILKPFERARLCMALDRVRDRIRANTRPPAVEAASSVGGLTEFLDALGADGELRDRVAVKQGDRVLLLDPRSIVYCEAADNYVTVRGSTGTYVIRATLGSLERRLASSGFARIHRSVLVNMQRVREIRPADHGDHEIVLDDGTRLPVSRTYRDRVLRRR